MAGQRLSIGIKLGYGVCDFGGNLFYTATAFMLMHFLTDTVGLAAVWAGTALFIGRIWDAFYDPFIGYVSDRTESRWGRRRPYLIIGAVPLGLAMVLMFTNPALLAGEGFIAAQRQTFLFLTTLVSYIILSTAYSTVNIPYCAMTPELTSDFHERTSLNGYRFSFAVFGTLIGAWTALSIVGLFDDKSIGYLVMGLCFGGIMLLSTMITAVSVPEPKTPASASTASIPATFHKVVKNIPYLIILATYVLHVVAITIVSASAIYYFKYILAAEDMTTPSLIILILTAMLVIPLSVLIARRIGKTPVYAGGMLIIAVGLMVLFGFGHLRPIGFTMGMVFVMGIGLGFTYAMPYAIVPDTIEYDYLHTGERREGAYYGLWTWGFKLGQALAAQIMGWVLSIMGYVANAMPQTETAALGIRLFLGPIPAALFVLAAVMLIFYPITEERYQAILGQIEDIDTAGTR
jgi:GPH family glycoside/pentoside/hexuronide:cation symporter